MSLSLIVLGGSPPSKPLLEKHARAADLTIAADSGLASFQSAGLKADIAVGDFDSFHGNPIQFAEKVISAPEQDATDFEKALRAVQHHTAKDEIVILGGTGLRADHFLTNLLIVAEKWPETSITFHDEQQSIYRVSTHCPLELESVKPQKTVSLIPFSSAHGVTATGLQWPLQDTSMEPGGQLGQSNRADDSVVNVSIKSGVLYVILNHIRV